MLLESEDVLPLAVIGGHFSFAAMKVDGGFPSEERIGRRAVGLLVLVEGKGVALQHNAYLIPRP